MTCVMEGSHSIKAFGKAVHALARIGDKLWLDPTTRGLALRSVNSSHSAYACFLFSPEFFKRYSPVSGSEQDCEPIRCQLVMKYVLPLFRSLSYIQGNVGRCEISVSPSVDRLRIKFFCRRGITKTYSLRYQESEALQAVFSSHLCANVLKAPARLLGDMVKHFPMSQGEVTLSITPLKVNMRSYLQCRSDGLKTTRTEVSFPPDEFDCFQVGVDSDVTFFLKELRGLLSFAESLCLPVSVHFGSAGQPMCFSAEGMFLEAAVVLSTMMDPESRGPSQSTHPPPSNPSRCAEVFLPVNLPEDHSNDPQNNQTEVIPSSQGSQTIKTPDRLDLLPKIQDWDNLRDESCGRVAAPPAPSVMCSFLFGALLSEEDDGRPASLPVLAWNSDAEDMEDDTGPRSPSV